MRRRRRERGVHEHGDRGDGTEGDLRLARRGAEVVGTVDADVMIDGFAINADNVGKAHLGGEGHHRPAATVR